MNYFDYRELRTLILQSRLLNYRIEMERMEARPNRFRLSTLKKLRFSVMERIASFMRATEQHRQNQAVLDPRTVSA
jgi:hypothetical protein